MPVGDSAAIAGSPRVVAQIDEQLKSVEAQLERQEALLRERRRLRAARATLLGESALGHISREDVAGYLAGHPGARPREIARALGVSAGRISAHLSRGRESRFESRSGGWHVRDAA